jgi:hypothetical protein
MTRCRSARPHERMAHGHETWPYILTRPIGRLGIIGINGDFLGQGLATVRKDLASAYHRPLRFVANCANAKRDGHS